MASDEVVNIETADASITTAAITIKALQVGKKQMTQSVFRQLPEALLVDEDKLELMGQPWGHVNYRWGDQRGTSFIFQVGARLYRCCYLIRSSEELDPEPLPSGYAQLHAEVTGWVKQSVCVALLEAKLPDWYDGRRYGYRHDVTLTHPYFENWRLSFEIDESMRFLMDQLERADRTDFSADVIARLAEKTATITSEITSEFKKRVHETFNEENTDDVIMSSLVVRIILQEMASKVKAYCNRWDELMDRLRAVEQLYIAV